MRYDYRLAFKTGVQVVDLDGVVQIIDMSGRCIRLNRPDDARRRLLSGLLTGGQTAGRLCTGADPARLHYLLLTLEHRGFLTYSVSDGGVVARLETCSPKFAFRDQAATDGAFRLSRFSCLRRVGDGAVLEGPLGHARVLVGNAATAAMVALLCAPHTVGALVSTVAGVEVEAAGAFLELLANAGVAQACDGDGRLPEDEHTALPQWEFHDLLFHTRSRAGRHDQPVGGTFRFRDRIAPLPAIKAVMSDRRIALHKPDLDADLDDHGPPFWSVLSHRASVRRSGPCPIQAETLGAFLYRVGQVKDIMPAAPDRGSLYEASHRPYPSGGAMYSIEFYLAIRRVAGIEPGFYHYAALDHALEYLGPLDGARQRLLTEATMSAAMNTPPDVQITLASRFSRVAWKYQAVAYSLVLKEVGAIYQTMYLVATALGLAPCAIGGGNSDMFAEAAGIDYYEETSVGEFMLSGLECTTS
ncbi:MAG: SagB family peptide dehydrogenase [Rhodospirillaceae bacterium]